MNLFYTNCWECPIDIGSVVFETQVNKQTGRHTHTDFVFFHNTYYILYTIGFARKLNKNIISSVDFLFFVLLAFNLNIIVFMSM